MDIDPDALVGTTIARRYSLKEIIGQGAMGVVFKADDLLEESEVAIKVLLPMDTRGEITDDMYNRFLERFRREAVAMQFNHPHIVPVYDTGIAAEAGNLAYLVMPYIAGTTLAKQIYQQGRLELHDALYYIRQIASALTLAHNRGVIHRDLKPGNLLIDGRGHLFVADFGIAHLEGSTLTEVGEFLGTRGYAAPEIVHGTKIDARADIYSLGVILYEMLTGELPRDSSARSVRLPSEIEAVIDKATAEDRQDRYGSAQDFTLAVNQVNEDLHSDPTMYAMPSESPRRPSRPLRRSQPTREPARPSPLKPSSSDNVPRRSRPLRPASIMTAQSSRNPWLIAIAAFVVIGIVLFIVSGIHWWQPSETASVSWVNSYSVNTEVTATPLITEQARQVVEQYYTDWNNKSYPAAYALLDSAYQKINSYATLLPDYQHTHYVCLSISNIDVQADGTIRVFITDNAIEDNMSNLNQQIVNLYTGYYLVRKRDTGLTIEPHLSIDAGQTGTCKSPA